MKNLPLLLKHKNFENYIWIALRDENQKIKTFLINRNDKDLTREIIVNNDEELENFINEFCLNGWEYGYIPSIAVKDSDGRVLHEIEFNRRR